MGLVAAVVALSLMMSDRISIAMGMAALVLVLLVLLGLRICNPRL